MSTTYQYRVRDPLGKVLAGTIDAQSEADATQQLRRDGFQVLELEDDDLAASGPGLFAPRITRNDVIYTTGQLAIMLDTGISLSAALLVTRSTAEVNLPSQFISQLFSRPQTLVVPGGLLGLLLFTRLPTLPLLAIGGGCIALATMLGRKQRNAEVAADVGRRDGLDRRHRAAGAVGAHDGQVPDRRQRGGRRHTAGADL